MSDFDPNAFAQLEVLPSHRIRYHLLRFDEGLTEALESGFRCDKHQASNLITQAHLIGFPLLANSLEGVYFDRGRSEGALRKASLAIEVAKSKIEDLLKLEAIRARAS